MSQHRPFLGLQLKPRQGIPAGILAGLVMAVFMMVLASLFGEGGIAWLQTIAATFMGAAAYLPASQTTAIVVGTSTHLLICIGLGVLYAASQDRLPWRETLVVALFYSFTIWVVASFILADWINPAILVFNRTWWGFLAHLMFGTTLAIFATRFGAPTPVLSPD
ncbi:MAG: hypothetical protein J5I90_07825 [Caldilineales bacterium]|nr:hypothetical protein [Caldilineales bacterium]